MEKKSSIVSRQHEAPNLDLKEWALKARISRENSNSRRFSASNFKSFRDETKSFRSNVTISSTTSSPGYTLREEIDPSTYSFTTALKALQAKTVYTWEFMSPDGEFTLNSKWNNAEKYISNPLSGEVPLECLSAKTLIGSSFRRITMSAPLIYPSHMQHQFPAKSPVNKNHENELKITSQSEKRSGSTRDVGTQSTLVDLISNTPPSPVSTPSIDERRSSRGEVKSEKEVEEMKEDTKTNGERKKCPKRRRCSCCCLSLRSLWMTIIHRDVKQ